MAYIYDPTKRIRNDSAYEALINRMIVMFSNDGTVYCQQCDFFDRVNNRCQDFRINKICNLTVEMLKESKDAIGSALVVTDRIKLEKH